MEEPINEEEIINDEITTGDEEEVKTRRPDHKKRNYLAIVLGGHVGTSYGTPFIVWVQARTLEEAVEVAKDTPRVKHDQKYAVLYCRRSSYVECLFNKSINEFDDYLNLHSNSRSYEEIESRRIKSPVVVERIQSDYIKTRSPKLLEELEEIKTADKFPDELPLQQRFSPIWLNGKLVFQDHNIDDTLKKYYTVMTKKVAMTRIENLQHARRLVAKNANTPWELTDKELAELGSFRKMINTRIMILMMYYKLFGRNNPLGINYYKKDHTLTYKASDRETITLKNGTTIKQAKLFLDAVFGKDNPLNIVYDEKTNSFTCDAKRVSVPVTSAIDLPKLYNDLFATKSVDPKTKKVKWIFNDPLKVYTSGGHIECFAYDQVLSSNKRLNLQKIYHALFDQPIAFSNRTYDPLKVSFDEQACTMTFSPRYIISIAIPEISFWDAIDADPEPGQENVSLEEKIMGRPMKPPYASPYKPLDDDDGDVDDADGATARPSAIDRFNARLAKTRAMQGLDGK